MMPPSSNSGGFWLFVLAMTLVLGLLYYLGIKNPDKTEKDPRTLINEEVYGH